MTNVEILQSIVANSIISILGIIEENSTKHKNYLPGKCNVSTLNQFDKHLAFVHVKTAFDKSTIFRGNLHHSLSRLHPVSYHWLWIGIIALRIQERSPEIPGRFTHRRALWSCHGCGCCTGDDGRAGQPLPILYSWKWFLTIFWKVKEKVMLWH